jgi:undecaprenyl-diphosphatase
LSYAQAALLGVVQGLTEFLPVSSSGHLVLTQALFGWGESDLLFEVTVHLATLLAVLVYYRKDIWMISRGALTGTPSVWQGMSTRSWVGLILVGSVPAALVGLGFKDLLVTTFADPYGTGLRLMATGALLFSTAPLLGKRLGIGWGQAGLVGLAQAVAILPGISRSGSTIATALHLNIDREQAARFSFLLSIPAVGGAFLLETKDVLGTTQAHVTLGRIHAHSFSCQGQVRAVWYLVLAGRHVGHVVV